MLADKIRSRLRTSVVVPYIGGYRESSMRSVTGSAKSGRTRGRKGERTHGKPRSEHQDDLVQSKLFELLSSTTKRKLRKDQEAIIEQTGSLFIDTSKIPLLKYAMSQRDLDRFQRSQCTSEERKRVLKTFEAILPRRKSQIPMIADSHRRINSQSLHGCLFPEKEKTPSDILDSVKDRICAYYSIQGSEYEKHKKAIESICVQENDKVSTEEGETLLEKVRGDPLLSGLALSLRQNPSLSDSERLDMANLLIEYSK